MDLPFQVLLIDYISLGVHHDIKILKLLLLQHNPGNLTWQLNLAAPTQKVRCGKEAHDFH